MKTTIGMDLGDKQILMPEAQAVSAHLERWI